MLQPWPVPCKALVAVACTKPLTVSALITTVLINQKAVAEAFTMEPVPFSGTGSEFLWMFVEERMDYGNV